MVKFCLDLKIISNYLNILFSANATYISKDTEYSDNLNMVQNVSFKCSVTTFFENAVVLDWKLTDKQKLRVCYLFHNKMLK